MAGDSGTDGAIAALIDIDDETDPTATPQAEEDKPISARCEDDCKYKGAPITMAMCSTAPDDDQDFHDKCDACAECVLTDQDEAADTAKVTDVDKEDEATARYRAKRRHFEYRRSSSGGSLKPQDEPTE